jgi:hypothetical protein
MIGMIGMSSFERHSHRSSPDIFISEGKVRQDRRLSEYAFGVGANKIAID